MSPDKSAKKDDEDEILRRENEKLRKEIDRLRKEIEKLQNERKKIEKEFEEYKFRHPETTGVKHGKPYHIKPPSLTKPKGKPGARPGHKGHYRKKPKHIDRTIEVPVEFCPHCGSKDLSKNIQETRTRTIEEIPKYQPIITQYNIHRRYCRTCRKLVEMPVHDALPGARFGIRTMLYITWLKIKLRMTLEAIPILLRLSFGMRLSKGEVQNILDQVTKVFEPYYEQMVEDMRKRPARNIDETSWRKNGENIWLWTFVTKWETIYHIASTRGHKAALEILGNSPNGVDIHDRFRAYNTLWKKTGKRHQQICWSHLLNDSKELAKLYGCQGGNHIQWAMKHLYEKGMAFNHQGTWKDVEDLKSTLERFIVRPFESFRCSKYVKNLLKYKDSMFEFVVNPDVDATNNRAERAIRPCVIARKVSGGSRSDRGAYIYSVLMSVVQTLDQNGKNIVTHGKEIIQTSHG